MMNRRSRSLEDVLDTIAPEEPTAEPEPEHYTVGQWAGLPNYECRHCAYSTLVLAEIEQHQVEQHAPPPPLLSKIICSWAMRLSNPSTGAF